MKFKTAYDPVEISIHALRKECDAIELREIYAQGSISIHALRKECDEMKTSKNPSRFNFYPRTP